MSVTRRMTEAVDQQIISLLQQLPPHEWDWPSLCAHWTVRGVVAHLISGSDTPLLAIGRHMLRQRGHFHRASEADAANLAAGSSNSELIERFMDKVGHPGGAGRLLPPRLLLGDHVVHLLDIAVACDRAVQIDAPIVAAVLRTQLAVPNPFVPARRLSHDLSLRAIDLDWARHTHGATVSGTGSDLIVALAGRTGTLERLTGNGVQVLAERIRTWKKKTDGPNLCKASA
jgi:uncharacterized protein (TIGR03083 family)